MPLNVDPDFALQTRLSLGPGGRYGWIAAAALALLWLSGPRGDESARIFHVLSVVCLYVALPYGAIHVRLLEYRGHLDLHRLHGRPPAVTLAWLLAGGSWWLLATGAALLVIPAAAGLMDGLATMATVTTSAAVAFVLLALPARTSAAWLWLLMVPALGALLLFAKMRESTPLMLTSVAVSSFAAAAAAPAAIGLLVRMGRARGMGFSRRWRLGNFARTRFPEFTRGLASTESPAMAAVVTAAMPLLVMAVARRTVPESRIPGFVALAYSPLIAIGFMLSSRLRADRESGGLERMRVAAQTPWRALGELTLGVTAPLLVMAASAIVTMLALDPQRAVPVIRPWPAVLVTVAALGAFEGIGSRILGIGMAPAMLLLMSLAMDDTTRWWTLFLVAWIPAALAVASVEGWDAQALRPAISCAAVASAAAWLGLQHRPLGQSVTWCAGVLSLAAPFLIPSPRRRSRVTFALCAATAWIAAAGAERLVAAQYPNMAPTWPSWVQNRTVFALFFGAVCSSGLAFGWLASQWANRRSSLVLRSVPLAMAWIVWRVFPRLLMDLVYLIALAIMILLLAAIAARRRNELAP
jgi:hypothetical protein